MANIFLDLPVPPGIGVGPAVDTSALGRVRTLTVSGQYVGSIVIEISNDGGNDFAPWAGFNVTTKRSIDVAAEYMRVRVTSINSSSGVPFSPKVGVSSNDNGVLTANLPSPGGIGPAVDVSALGTFNTFVATAVATQQSKIQISEDGIDWSDCVVFTSPDYKSLEVVAKFMRVIGPAGVEVDVAAVNDGGSAAMDELVKVSADDTTSGLLDAKLTAGDGITLTELNPGANESVEIKASGPALLDEKVKVSADDTTPGYLDAKLVAGSGITLTELNPGGDEDVEIKVDGADAGDIVTGPPITVRGPTNAEGVGDPIALAGHVHRLELEVLDEGVLEGARPAANFVGVGVTAVDNPGQDRVDITIPGTSDGGAMVKRSLYKGDTVSTSGLVYVDGMSGGVVTVPIDGDYWAVYEGEGKNQAASAIAEVGISVNSLVAVVANSDRESQGNANDIRPMITTVQLGTLTAGDVVRMLFRKSSGAGTVSVMRRHLSIFLVQ
jgi:hypothetical protein